MYHLKSIYVTAAAAMLLTPLTSASDSIADAIKAGEAHLDFRLRYEDVDQENPANKGGEALTLKTRLNYKTGAFNGLTSFIEVDNVSAFDKNSYNSTINGQGTKSVIADPTGTEVNQAWLQYSNWDTTFKYGRQRINLDGQRFVGGVGFRQNEQTYDAFSVTNKSLESTEFFYARVNNVNRIFGEQHSGSDHSSDSDLLHVKFTGLENIVVSAYAYLLDSEDVARFSTDTYGIRLAGKVPADAMTFGYTLEYARQEDADNNTLKYDADYMLAEASLAIRGVNVTLGYEVLGSDDGAAAFITPLATLHKFQGWTDQFLKTPAEGIADVYFSVGGKLAGVKLLAVYHEFTADEKNVLNDDDLGSEFGFVVAKGFGAYGLNLKYASYSDGDASFGKSSTDKIWLTATAKF